jgi:hypothetical protein
MFNAVSGSGQGTLAPWGTAVIGFSGGTDRTAANKISNGSVTIVLQNGARFMATHNPLSFAS